MLPWFGSKNGHSGGHSRSLFVYDKKAPPGPTRAGCRVSVFSVLIRSSLGAIAPIPRLSR
jgi:hypothetical protein